MAWLCPWHYRRAITITEQSGNDLTDYPVPIDLTSVALTGASSSGIDIRFTKDDGTTLLDYWREAYSGSLSGNTKKFRVLIPSLAASSSITIYVYYYNSSASDVSTTSIFLDDISGLTAAYHFDTGSGDTMYDSSGNGYDSGFSGSWEDGVFNKAIYYDGSHDDKNEAIVLPTDAITVIVWANPDKQTDYWQKWIETKYDSSNYDEGIYGVVNKDSTSYGVSLHLTWDDKDTNKGTSTSSTGWHFFAMGWDGSEVYGGVDGAWDDKGSGGTDPDWASQPLWTGSNAEGSEKYYGKIDELLIFNHALTSQQISDLFNNYGETSPYYHNHLLIHQWVSPNPSISISDPTPNFAPTVSINEVTPVSAKRGNSFYISGASDDDVQLTKTYFKIIRPDNTVMVDVVFTDKNWSYTWQSSASDILGNYTINAQSEDLCSFLSNVASDSFELLNNPPQITDYGVEPLFPLTDRTILIWFTASDYEDATSSMQADLTLTKPDSSTFSTSMNWDSANNRFEYNLITNILGTWNASMKITDKDGDSDSSNTNFLVFLYANMNSPPTKRRILSPRW